MIPSTEFKNAQDAWDYWRMEIHPSEARETVPSDFEFAFNAGKKDGWLRGFAGWKLFPAPPEVVKQ